MSKGENDTVSGKKANDLKKNETFQSGTVRSDEAAVQHYTTDMRWQPGKALFVWGSQRLGRCSERTSLAATVQVICQALLQGRGQNTPS